MVIEFVGAYYLPFIVGVGATAIGIGSCVCCTAMACTDGDPDKIKRLAERMSKAFPEPSDNKPQFKIKLPNTIHMTDLARKGEITGAYQRESKMQELIDGVNQGSVIIVGPSGSGKTALAEELSVRIVKNKTPSLRDFEVIRLNLRKITGGAGIKQDLVNLWSGDVENRVRDLIEQLQAQHGKGNECILFIDEIQDLLQNGIEIFDQFKEELARKGFRLVGATTDRATVDKLRGRDGSGAGMARRIQVIELTEMTTDETLLVIQDFMRNPPPKKYSSVNFQYADDFALAVVELSKSRYPEKIFPDCAVSLYEDLHRYYFDLSPQKGSTILLGLKEVVHYLAEVKEHPREVLFERVQRAVANRTFKTQFPSNFFLRLPHPAKLFSSIEEKAQRLAAFFENPRKNPFLCVKVESECLFQDAAALFANQTHEEIFLCDLSQLASKANTEDGIAYLRSALQELFLGKSKKPFLVLTGFNPHWSQLPAGQAATHVPSEIEARVAKALDNPQIRHIASAVDPQLGSILDQAATEIRKPIPRPWEREPTVVTRLLEFIEREKIPTLMAQKDDFPAVEKWNFISMQPLSLDAMIETVQIKTARLSEEIRALFYAFHILLDSSPFTSIVDRVLQLLNHPEKSLEPVLLKILEGKKSSQEIKTAFRRSEEWIKRPPFTPLSPNPPVQDRPQLKDFPRAPTVFVNEESSARKQWLAAHLAALAPSKTSFWFDPQVFQELPHSLQQCMIQNMRASSGLIFTTEQGLAELKPLERNYQIVVFRAPPKAPSPSSLTPLLEEGKEAIQALLPPVLKYTEYTPPPLSDAERKTIFHFFFPLPDMEESKKEAIINLYLLLCEKGASFDAALQLMKDDLSKPGTNPALDFTQLHGKKYNFSLQDARYAENPAQVSWTYRTGRVAKAALRTSWHYLTLPPRFIFSHPKISVLSVTVSWGVSRIFPWLRYRILKI